MKISIFALTILSLPFVAVAGEPCQPTQEGCQQQVAPCEEPKPTPQPVPSGPAVQAPTPSSYLYLAFVEWRKKKRQPLPGNRIREFGGHGLIGGQDDSLYYDEFTDEVYQSSLPAIGGSFYFRAYRLDTGLGLEASWDFIRYHDFEELRQVALMKYIPLTQKVRAYVLVGGGLTTYDPGYSVQAGVGLDYPITKRLSIHADLRSSYVNTKSSSGDSAQPTQLETLDAVLNIGGGWKFVSVLERLQNAAP
jgi:hypothetical protein